jgi:glyoxylase-like metal-dependent hydrolase (beta-lactamase superfamily II)
VGRAECGYGRRVVDTYLNLVDGVHWIEHAYTNCYVVVDDSGVTLIDACFPSTWRAVVRALHGSGRSVGDIRGLVLTHGHFDHVGFARRIAREHGIGVWVHGDDKRLAAHPYRYRPERNRALYPFGHPGSLPILSAMVAAGALTIRGVEADHIFADGDVLPLPGAPRVLHTPGHTAGQCGLLLSDRSVLLSGDALVTLDPYTGRRGPRLVAPAATADSEQALRSLDRFAELDAQWLLPGHGEVWNSGVSSAVELARRESRSD